MDRFLLTVNLITLVAGIITIIWFFGDMRRENAKLLKEISQILFNSQKILENHTQLFKEIIELLKK